MFIRELFDRNNAFNVVMKKPHYYEAHAQTKGGPLIFTAERDNETFVWDVMFDVDGETRATGHGKPIDVFSVVVAIFKDFISSLDVEDIEFSVIKDGTTNSRTKLYDKLILKLAKEHGFYDISHNDNDIRKDYRLTTNPEYYIRKDPKKYKVNN